MNKYILSIAAILLVGCASNGRLDSSSEYDPTYAIMLVSATKAGLGDDALFFYKKVGSDNSVAITALGPRATPMAKPGGKHKIKPKTEFRIKRDFTDKETKIGRVLAYQVPAGDYEFVRWEISIPSGTVQNLNIKSGQSSPLAFSLKAGEITYIGNIHLQTRTEKGLFGAKVAAGGYANITNQKDTDIPIFKEKYPNLKNVPITTDVPESLEWGFR